MPAPSTYSNRPSVRDGMRPGSTRSSDIASSGWARPRRARPPSKLRTACGRSRTSAPGSSTSRPRPGPTPPPGTRPPSSSSAEDSLYWQDYDAALKHFGLASVRASLADEAAAGQERARRGQEASRQMVLSSEYYGRGQYEQAVERARQALAAFRDLEARRGQLNSLLRIGWGLSAQFKHREALEAYTEAKTLAETLQVEGLTASVETSLGGHYAGFGEYEKAIGHHRRAQALRRRTNSVLEEAWSVLPSIGWVQSRLGDSDARDLVLRAGPGHPPASHLPAGRGFGPALPGQRLPGAGRIPQGPGRLRQGARDRPGPLIRRTGHFGLFRARIDLRRGRRRRERPEVPPILPGRSADPGPQVAAGQRPQQSRPSRPRDGQGLRPGHELLQGFADPGPERSATADGGRRHGQHRRRPIPPRETTARRSACTRRPCASSGNSRITSLEMQGLNEIGETYLGLKDYDRAIDCQTQGPRHRRVPRRPLRAVAVRARSRQGL